MLSIVFHLALTFALLWYQRRQHFKPKLWEMTLLWYVVSVALALIETLSITGSWFTGMFLQAMILALFYVPSVFFALHMGERKQLPIWKSFSFFLLCALVSTMAAAVTFAYSPFIQHLSS